MKRWNQVNKRLKTIIAPELKIAFNKSNLRLKTGWSKLNRTHFYIKLNDEILWECQKDSAYCNFRYYDEWFSYGRDEKIGKLSPANIIAQYLDTPRDKLLQFEEPSGLKYILWACDKRIGKDRLAKMRFTKWALPIVKERVPNYNLEPIIHQPRPIIYTCDEFTVFDIDEYKFDDDFLFVVANNIDYSSSTHATCLEEKRAKKGYWKVPSKKILNLSDEQIKIVKEEVKKYVEKIKTKEGNENVETQEE